MFKAKKLLNVSLLLVTFLITWAQVAWSSNSSHFSHQHEVWNALLNKHVTEKNAGSITTVNYGAMKQDRPQLKTYLNSLSKVQQKQFDTWTKEQQLAFLINAYNAWTVELILSQWPKLSSIKDIGSFFSSPWKQAFIPLFGKTLSLDDIEQGLIRGSGKYKEPRIHFAVNCASIGCPALRAEAYVAERLEQQLLEQTLLFLSDRSRNRSENNILKLSSIFKWYREDFEKGWKMYTSLESFLLAHAKALNLPAETTKALKEKRVRIEFLDYDWQLNQ